MVEIKDLVKEITKAVTDYTQEVKDEVALATDELTKEGVKLLKLKSPANTGDYRKGWARKKTATGFVLYNRTSYQLTHLLEHGHAKVSGGRVPARVHIRPVEEELVDKFEKRIEKVIRG